MKQKAPGRINTHWDYLLREMEWMSTDFYEERKFKMAGAFLLSKAIREYHAATDRESLLHKVSCLYEQTDNQWPRRMRAPVKHFEEEVDADEEDVLMVNHRGSASPISMDREVDMLGANESALVNGDAESGDPMQVDGNHETKEPLQTERETLPTPSPSSSEMDDLPAIFDLPSDVIYATVHELPKKDGSSLSQLPLYGPPTVTDDLYHNPIDELPIVPISKFCLERYVVPVANWEPPNRNYRHTAPDDVDEMSDISREVQVEALPGFAPAGAGMFFYRWLLTVEDAAHSSRRRSSMIVIRPPPPPAHWTEQKSSPWTLEEEHKLLQLAKDNQYNFDLVASTLAFPGSSISDLEKRSAWECFEKFRQICPEPQNIQLLGPNRTAAMNRLEKIHRLSVSGANRPKPNALVRQPRLEVRSHRFLTLFDAMKKSSKNREKSKSQGIALQDDFAHVPEKQPVKKTKDNLPTKTAQNVPTPLDLSRLKAERDRAYNQAVLAERQAQVLNLQ